MWKKSPFYDTVLGFSAAWSHILTYNYNISSKKKMRSESIYSLKVKKQETGR